MRRHSSTPKPSGSQLSKMYRSKYPCRAKRSPSVKSRAQMIVYSARVSVTNSRESSSSSTKRMRFFSLLEFAIPFVRSEGALVGFSCRGMWAFFPLSLSKSKKSARKWGVSGRLCHKSLRGVSGHAIRLNRRNALNSTPSFLPGNCARVVQLYVRQGAYSRNPQARWRYARNPTITHASIPCKLRTGSQARLLPFRFREVSARFVEQEGIRQCPGDGDDAQRHIEGAFRLSVARANALTFIHERDNACGLHRQILDLRRGNEWSTAFLFTSRIAGRRIRPSTSHGEAPIEPLETKGLPHDMAYTCCRSLPDPLTCTIIHYGQRRTKAQRRARKI